MVDDAGRRNYDADCMSQTLDLPSAGMINREEIRRRREAIGMTMVEAAVAAGFKHRQQWYAIETGQRKGLAVETLSAVARALRCNIDDLMQPSQPEKPTRKRKTK